MRSIFFLISFLLLTLSVKAQGTNSDVLIQNIGNIKYDPKTDKSSFHLCDPKAVIPYYAVNTLYRGGTAAVKKYILQNFKFNPAFKSQNGYVTIRFIINCKGETDRFRVYQLDNDFQKKSFNPDMVNQLKKLTQNLHDWLPGKDRKFTIDYYSYLTFFIIDGNIKDIAP